VAFTPQADYTDREKPFVGEVSANVCRYRGVAWSAQRVTTAINLGFLDCLLSNNKLQLHFSMLLLLMRILYTVKVKG
jgi:hypothetical protein